MAIVTWAVIVALAVAAVAHLTVGIVLWRRIRAFRRSAVRAPASIVGFRTKADSDGDLLHFPIFRFRDQHGGEHEVCSQTGESPPGFAEGESMTVLYDPSKPAKARIESFWQMWLVPASLLFVAVVCGFLLAAWLLLAVVGNHH
jgi:hypothetical protein